MSIVRLDELLMMTYLKMGIRLDRTELTSNVSTSVYDKIRTYTIVDGEKVYNTPTREEWDTAMNEVVADLIRELRNMKLQETDRYSLPDYPHTSEEKRQEWLNYRQTLRDYMDTFTFDVPEHGCINHSDITWPDPPSS